MTEAARHRRPGVAVVLVGLLVGLLAGCGVPERGTQRPVADEDVPYGLLSTASTSPRPWPPRNARSRIALLDREEQIVWRARHVDPGGDALARIQALLDQLVAGPTTGEQAEGLTSALPTGWGLQAHDLRDGRLAVSVVETEQATPGSRGQQWPQGVAQLVLTVTSVPSVRTVVVDRGGTPVDLPLPDGRLAGRPVTRQDYVGLLARTRTPSASPSPSSSSSRP